MDRTLPGFEEAAESVKVGVFASRGIDITGVVHVGTNWGEEIEYYLAMGIPKVVGFEPLLSAFSACCNRYYEEIEAGKLAMFQIALGSKKARKRIKEIITASGDTGGSSFLKEDLAPLYATHPTLKIKKQPADICRFDWLFPIGLPLCNCLVVDVQGMELDVLVGMGKLIKDFDCLNIECSRVPAYEGEAAAAEVVQYLHQFGFVPITPIEDHNDILFVKEGL